MILTIPELTFRITGLRFELPPRVPIAVGLFGLIAIGLSGDRIGRTETPRAEATRPAAPVDEGRLLAEAKPLPKAPEDPSAAPDPRSAQRTAELWIIFEPAPMHPAMRLELQIGQPLVAGFKPSRTVVADNKPPNAEPPNKPKIAFGTYRKWMPEYGDLGDVDDGAKREDRIVIAKRVKLADGSEHIVKIPMVLHKRKCPKNKAPEVCYLPQSERTPIWWDGLRTW